MLLMLPENGREAGITMHKVTVDQVWPERLTPTHSKPASGCQEREVFLADYPAEEVVFQAGLGSL